MPGACIKISCKHVASPCDLIGLRFDLRISVVICGVLLCDRSVHIPVLSGSCESEWMDSVCVSNEVEFQAREAKDKTYTLVAPARSCL